MENIVNLLDKELERSLTSEKRYDEVLELIRTITAPGQNESTNVYQPVPFSNEIDANLPQVALVKTRIKSHPNEVHFSSHSLINPFQMLLIVFMLDW